mmetsp:Transcript_2463/g.5879  ORF Transcript_2463/g.5879 Transcript_2463/m.5879 type:complete len:129 (-) Transcript_2463:51-437(-)
MEDLSLAEEFVLARSVDVLVGVYGSGMWWSGFMNSPGVVVWLRAHRHFGGMECSGGWKTKGMLEFLRHDLSHRIICGVLPPDGTPGYFEGRDIVEEDWNVHDFDVYVNASEVVETVAQAVRRLSEEWT